MKYIFVAGAPGSKWSSVVKNIYYSPDVDQSDYSAERTYYHDASGTRQLMHLGAYFDPLMEFDLPDTLAEHTKEQLEQLFDSAFTGTGVRIVKSHFFAYEHNWQVLRRYWPDCPIVFVQRSNDACLGWWVKCGHFDITYPRYDIYQNLRTMAKMIEAQNAGIERAVEFLSPRYSVNTNHQLCRRLGLALPPPEYSQEYDLHDIKVSVIC